MKATGLALGLLCGAAPLAAQGVVIAPHAVFIDARTRSGAVLLYNPNTEPVEVAVSFFFRYPATDSAGRIVVDSIGVPIRRASRPPRGFRRFRADSRFRRSSARPSASWPRRLRASPTGNIGRAS